jgi:D-3-phosphoglycerate dehydrogenase
MPDVAVASRSFSRHPVLRSELTSQYSDVRFNDSGASLGGEDLRRFLDGCDKAIIALERIDAALLAALPALRVISKYGVGLDSLDLEAMERHQVALGWTPGVNRRSVAELVVAFAIALLHRVPEATALVQQGGWRQITGRQLSGRTVGVVGCGHVGKDVCRLIGAFGCRLLAHDIQDYAEFYRQHGVTAVGLDALLSESDVVTLHLPWDASTRNIVDAGRLGLMRERAILINTARGGLVDEAALARALAGGTIAGAAFDVFATEPPEDRGLVSAPNFIATPHIGGSTEEAILAMGRAAIAGLATARPPSECLAV